MTTNMLGKVVAGAALGGASLLAFTPGIAFADGAQGGQGHHHKGKVIADPNAVQPGHDVKLIEVCAEAQEHAYVWSKVTGKVKLHSRDHHDQKGGHDRGGYDDEGRGHDDKGGYHDKGRGHDDKGRGHDWRNDEEGGWSDEGDESPASPQPTAGMSQPGGRGGGDEAKKDDEAKKKAEEDAKRKKAEAEAEAAAEAAAEEKAKEKAAAEAAAEAEAEAAEEAETYFVYYGEAKVAADAEPGTYKLKGSCGEGTLTVLPNGAVDGGDGGATGDDRGMAVGGAAVLGAAALGGIVLMRRRRTNESLV